VRNCGLEKIVLSNIVEFFTCKIILETPFTQDQDDHSHHLFWLEVRIKNLRSSFNPVFLP
jgi:hypothetical protein